MNNLIASEDSTVSMLKALVWQQHLVEEPGKPDWIRQRMEAEALCAMYRISCSEFIWIWVTVVVIVISLALATHHNTPQTPSTSQLKHSTLPNSANFLSDNKTWVLCGWWCTNQQKQINKTLDVPAHQTLWRSVAGAANPGGPSYQCTKLWSSQ